MNANEISALSEELAALRATIRCANREIDSLVAQNADLRAEIADLEIARGMAVAPAVETEEK